MPILTSQKGWHTVLTLNSSQGYQGITQSFAANKPYILFFSCRGAGSLQVSYPAATETAPCTAAPELNGTQTFEPMHAGENVTISVTATGTIDWELIVSMQD